MTWLNSVVKRLLSSTSDEDHSNESSESTNHETITKFMASHKGNSVNAGYMKSASASLSSLPNYNDVPEAPITKLPLEILITIFTFLKPRDLFVASLICKHFNRIISKSEKLAESAVRNKLPIEHKLLDRMRRGQTWPDFYRMEIKNGLKGLHTWGSNEDGVLGVGIAPDQLPSQCSPRPVRKLANQPIRHISFIKSTSTAILERSDSVYFCGSEKSGSYSTPTVLSWKQLKGKTIKKFMFEHRNYMALTSNPMGVTPKHELYMWGSNKNGQLFQPQEIQSVSQPLQIFTKSHVTKAYVGRQFSVVMTSEGKVYAVGLNVAGKLGVGKEKDTDVFLSGDLNEVSVKIPEKVVKMAFGARHSLFLTESGKLWAAGSNSDGQLGNPASLKYSNVPVQVMCPPNVRFIKIACGFFHCIALSSCGEVYVWGCSSKGELGIAVSDCVRIPTKIENVKEVIQIVGAGFHTYCLTKHGEMWGCGYNSAHQVGHQDKSIVTIMSPIPAMKGKIVTKIVAGGFHTGAFVFNREGSPYMC